MSASFITRFVLSLCVRKKPTHVMSVCGAAHLSGRNVFIMLIRGRVCVNPGTKSKLY